MRQTNLEVVQIPEHVIKSMKSNNAPPQADWDEHTPDIELITVMRAGQIEALQFLYRRYSRLVYTLAQRIVFNSEEAEEITQDVFLKLWHQDAYQPARGSLSRYLVVMTRSRAIDRLRSQTSHRHRLQKWQLSAQAASVPTPLDWASLEERTEHLKAALKTLSTHERHILEIAYYEGLSQSEIAQRLEIPLGTVKSRSRQALRKLRQTLKDHLQP